MDKAKVAKGAAAVLAVKKLVKIGAVFATLAAVGKVLRGRAG